MTDSDDDRIAARARVELAAAAEQLDADTRRRLAQARYAALDALPRARGFRWRYAVGGVAAAGVVAVLVSALGLLQPAPTHAPVAEQALADIDLLATTDGPDFYVELEFYEWLADDGHAG